MDLFFTLSTFKADAENGQENYSQIDWHDSLESAQKFLGDVGKDIAFTSTKTFKVTYGAGEVTQV